MPKTKLGARTFLYPMPTTLVGANVGGKPNFLAVAYTGIVDHDPPLISIALGKSHHTNPGIKENGTFSVNIPSADMVGVTDHCGLVSGKKEDKSGLFTVFYGELMTAPMIEECPLCLECRVVDHREWSVDEMFIGEIVQAHASQGALTDGVPDMSKIDPILFSMHENMYYRVGESIGKAWSVGKGYKKG